MTALLWFRRDLRLADHPALVAAADDGPVLPVYVRDPAHEPSAGHPRRRRDASLAAMREATDGALVVRTGEPGAVLEELATQVGAAQVHATIDATGSGRRREAAVATRLERGGRRLVRTGTGYAVAPGTLLTAGRTPYLVFTPFSRAWRSLGAAPPLPVPVVRWLRGPVSEDVPVASPDLSGGERAAWVRWQEFLDTDLAGYDEGRDRPDQDATSRMSAHLAWGEVHPRQLLADLGAHTDPSEEGPRRLVDELCWREFCADVLWNHPDSEETDLRPELASLEHDPAGPDVQAWREGRTGFPLVDAGMRQLGALGGGRLAARP